MDASVLVVGTTLIVALALVGVAVYGLRRRSDAKAGDGAVVERLDERLAQTHDETRTHLEHPPRVRSLAVVGEMNSHPSHVPVIRVDLGTTDAPGPDIVFEYVASVLEAVHPLLASEGVLVHHYDVQFSFGPGGLLVSSECRRVAVPLELVDQLVSDDRYRPHDLRRDVTAGDDGDDATAPVAWGECVTYDDS